MGYALQQDLIDRCGDAEMAAYAGDGNGGLDAVKIARALADADALIDRHLAARYLLPLTVPDLGLTRIACDLARYTLRGDELKSDNIIAVNYQAALKQLLALAQGVTQLQAAGVALAEAPASGVAFTKGKPTFLKPPSVPFAGSPFGGEW